MRIKNIANRSKEGDTSTWAPLGSSGMFASSPRAPKWGKKALKISRILILDESYTYLG
jgi:hypothetical protein